MPVWAALTLILFGVLLIGLGMVLWMRHSRPFSPGPAQVIAGRIKKAKLIDTKGGPLVDAKKIDRLTMVRSVGGSEHGQAEEGQEEKGPLQRRRAAR
jgi:hypothetical protein